MKILHTADWHIGKRLHKKDLAEDFQLFIDWLHSLIQKEAIDILLIAGDVFDLSNPSSESRTLYYQSLIKLKDLGCKIIITGGNHDSVNMLNAPKELLRALDINVIGGLTEDIADMVIPYTSKEGETIVVGAIPYLRDQDLRSFSDTPNQDNLLEKVQMGIETIYRKLANYCMEHYPQWPIVAMGHLFVAGSSTSDSEREIQVGNQALFSARRFPKECAYYALGHIHKPQQISAEFPIYYSGSPIPLSFSEREDHKRVLLIDTQEGFTPKSIEVPNFRRLIRISGSLETIQAKLNNLPDHSVLPNLLELHLIEEQYNVESIYTLDDIIHNFNHPSYEIVHRTMTFTQKENDMKDYFQRGMQLKDLSPLEVFEKMMEDHAYEEETYQHLIQAFVQLHSSIVEDEN